MDTGDRLLTPGEVAALFRVDPKTVTRWAAAGRIGSIRTPGGHRRFRESEVRALLEGEGLAGFRGRHALVVPSGEWPPVPLTPRRSALGAKRGPQIGRAGRSDAAGPSREQGMGDADDVKHLARDEVDELLCGSGRTGRVKARDWPATPWLPHRPARRDAGDGRATRASPAGTTTTLRRSFRLTSAARCSRSFDRPIAMPAHAAVLAGTTIMPRAG